MRNHFARAASSGIDWSLPQSVEAWSDTAGDYTMTSEGNASQGLSVAGGFTSPDGRAGSVRSVGRTTSLNDVSLILRGYKVAPSDLVLASGRSYRIDGTVEIRSTNSTPYDPQEWGVYLNCYRETDHTDLLQRVTVITFARPSSNTDALETYDETITLPTGTRSIELAVYEESIMPNVNPGSMVYTYENTIALVT